MLPHTWFSREREREREREGDFPTGLCLDRETILLVLCTSLYSYLSQHTCNPIGVLRQKVKFKFEMEGEERREADGRLVDGFEHHVLYACSMCLGHTLQCGQPEKSPFPPRVSHLCLYLCLCFSFSLALTGSKVRLQAYCWLWIGLLGVRCSRWCGFWPGRVCVRAFRRGASMNKRG